MFDKCKAQYGNKGDGEMVNMLLRSQLNICSIKTSSSGHRDRFEMDLLQRLHKIRQAKAKNKQRHISSSNASNQESGSMTKKDQSTKVKENRDLNKMFTAYTGTSQEKAEGAQDFDDESEEDEEAKNFQD